MFLRFNVSDCIEKVIESAKLEDKLHLMEPVFTLISYFSDVDTSNKQKINLWEFADRLYPDRVPSMKQLPNLQKFSWEVCNQWLLNLMFEEIQTLETVEILAQCFNSDSEKTVQWLDDFLDFSASYNSQLIEPYAVFSNQFGVFKPKKGIDRDKDIPEELKDILAILTSNHWKDILLHEGLVKVGNLFGEKETKTIENIATEIDKEIRGWEQSDRKNDSKFVDAILAMMKWFQGQEERKVQRIFPYFYDRRAQLFLRTIDDSEVSDNIFTVLQHPEKLESLAKLAENPNISEEDIHNFAENQGQFREFQNLRQQLSDRISIEDVRELVENKDKFETLKLLQDAAEAEETPDLLIAALQELGIYQVVVSLFGSPDLGQGSHRYTAIPSLKQCTIYSPNRGFNYKQRLAAIGRQGEEFVYKKLVERFGAERVLWMNEDGEKGQPYDFVVRGENGEEELYIDAKTTSTPESSADRIPFFVGRSEWHFSANSDRYYLARVFLIWTEPEVRFLKFVRLLDESRAINIEPQTTL